jgi:hypothetical protein
MLCSMVANDPLCRSFFDASDGMGRATGDMD